MPDACCRALALAALKLVQSELGLELGDLEGWVERAAAAQPDGGGGGQRAARLPSLGACTLQFGHACRCVWGRG